MFTDLSDIDETTQAKVGAEIWTVKSDKHRIQKEQKARQLYLHNFLSEKPLCVYGDNYLFLDILVYKNKLVTQTLSIVEKSKILLLK